jgi:hypothetical protein
MCEWNRLDCWHVNIVLISDAEKRHIFSPPPDTLLEVITQWVSDNPTLCLAALLVNVQLVLPTGGIPVPAITPFAGLFK